ncbi:YihY/virulence factor BrkB family protein [Candidatus Laterigemmans baculatus]|uniref:YihY/virulence factor BrkB family protein n=1 Tax=Candidatus Laterigemmans baculatus TaxID=2770505 RepID=UPI0013D8F417|nr:YihY/virulence factor BrkB family protein [Candidatus Laterigemmans baculatus]
MGKWFGWLKQAAIEFSDDECLSSGAALAYYTIFSLPPLLAMIFFIAGLFGASQDQIQQVVSSQLGVPIAEQQAGGAEGDSASSSGGDTGEAASDSEGLTTGPGSLGELAGREGAQSDFAAGLGPLSKVIGIAILIFSATGVFSQLQFALNRAWEVEPDPEQGGIRNFIGKRLLSLGMILVIAFLLLVSLVLTTMLEQLTQMVLGEPDQAGKIIGFLVNNLVALVVAILLFAAMFRWLPDAKMRWRDMWVGATVTAVLFIIGKLLIGFYLQNSKIGASWGTAAASLIAMLVWVYYSSLIVLFGAELTQIWARRFGSGIEPTEGAVRIKEEKRHVRGADS